MTEEQQRELARALMHEREGYERVGRMDRVAMVDAQLESIGVTPTPAARERRPQRQAETR